MEEVKEMKKELDMEQLDEVSGGYNGETSYDSEFLNRLGLCEYYDGKTLRKDWDKHQEIVDAWAKVGVTVRAHLSSQNLYKVNGKYVSRLEALAYVKEKYKAGF